MNLEAWTNELLKNYGKNAEVEEIHAFIDAECANIVCIIRKKEPKVGVE